MKPRLLLTLIVVCFTVLFLSTHASALYIADITYDYVDNGSGNYTFNLTVSNNSTDGDNGVLDFFMIDLDADPDFNSAYGAIGWTSDGGWYAEADDPDGSFGGLPGYVLADDSFLGTDGGGIAQGDSLDGFGFSFDYAGPLGPGEQEFFFLAQFGTFEDAFWGYDYMGDDTGFLRYDPQTQPPVNPVPEPTTLALLSLGTLGLASFGRKRRK